MSGIHEGVFRELQILGTACLAGAGMAAVYDMLRIFRRIMRHGIVWVSIEDCLYWIAFAVVEFILLYQENNGVLRGYIFGGTAVGAILYHFLVSRHIMRFVSRLIIKIKKRLKLCYKGVIMKLTKKQRGTSYEQTQKQKK